MPREIHLNGVVEDDDRIPVVIGEGETAKKYLLRPMTRDLRKKVNAVEAKVTTLDEERLTSDMDDDDYYDRMVALFCEGLDVLLEIDTTGEQKHRTPASKVLLAGYQENKLGWSQIASYYSGLRDKTEEARPI